MDVHVHDSDFPLTVRFPAASVRDLRPGHPDVANALDSDHWVGGVRCVDGLRRSLSALSGRMVLAVSPARSIDLAPTDEFTEPPAAIRIVGVHVRKTGIGPDELQAIERIKHGDVAGLEPLVRKYQHEALRIAQVITRDRALSEDVVQQAFLQAFERRSSFDAERPFAPWFFRIVVNAAMKAATRRSRIFPLTSEDPSAGAAWGEAESELERVETAEDVRRALSRLSPRLRATVVLRYYLDLSEGEMAERLAVPRGTIKRRLHDARIRLRQLLAAGRPG